MLVFFTCNHCPYAIAVWPRMIRISKLAGNLGIKSVAINPNIHPDYPEDSPEKMIKKIEKMKIAFPYLFDKHHLLVYHGRINDSWRDESKVTKEELKDAVERLSKGQPVNSNQRPSMGCSIKWR